MSHIPMQPDVHQKSNQHINKRQLISKGQNFNREGVTKDLAQSSDIYNEIKHLYGNHYSRYNILTNM